MNVGVHHRAQQISKGVQRAIDQCLLVRHSDIRLGLECSGGTCEIYQHHGPHSPGTIRIGPASQFQRNSEDHVRAIMTTTLQNVTGGERGFKNQAKRPGAHGNQANPSKDGRSHNNLGTWQARATHTRKYPNHKDPGTWNPKVRETMAIKPTCCTASHMVMAVKKESTWIRSGPTGGRWFRL